MQKRQFCQTFYSEHLYTRKYLHSQYVSKLMFLKLSAILRLSALTRLVRLFYIFQQSDMNSIIYIIIKPCVDIDLSRLQASKAVNHCSPHREPPSAPGPLVYFHIIQQSDMNSFVYII